MSQTFVYQEGQDGAPIIIDCIPYPKFPSNETATVTETNMEDPNGATSTAMRVKSVDNPSFVQEMILSASRRPTRVKVSANGGSTTLSLTPARGSDAILMKLKGTTIWMPKDDENGSETMALTGLETAAILFMVSVVAGVAVYSMSNDGATCNVEVESGGEEEQGGGGREE